MKLNRVRFGIWIGQKIKQESTFVCAKGDFMVKNTINTSVQQPQNESIALFTENDGDTEIASAKALSLLIIQLQEARNDAVSYSEKEVYNIFGVEKLRM